jgi:predicted ester cyclase
MITIDNQTQNDLEKLHLAIAEWGWMAQADFFAEKYLNHGVESSREKTRAVLHDIVTTFPDIHFEPIQTIVQNDWVVQHCWFVGTHLGVTQHPYLYYGLLTDVPATGKTMRVQHTHFYLDEYGNCQEANFGKTMRVQHTHFYRFDNGLIVEYKVIRDDVGMVKQLGLSFEIGLANI